MSATFLITDRQLEELLPVTVPQLRFKNDTQLVRPGKGYSRNFAGTYGESSVGLLGLVPPARGLVPHLLDRR